MSVESLNKSPVPRFLYKLLKQHHSMNAPCRMRFGDGSLGVVWLTTRNKLSLSVLTLVP